jgi:glycosyltransferase involved in cell wall biosynthesis
VRLAFLGEALGHSDETNATIRREVDAAIRAHGLEDRVTRTGPLSLTDVSAALQSCDALVFPFDDGASFRRSSLAAALAHGCPVVTTLRPDGRSGVPGFEHERDLLLIPPGDAPALAAALNRLRDDRALRARLGIGARNASQLLEWPTIAGAIATVYARSLGIGVST